MVQKHSSTAPDTTDPTGSSCGRFQPLPENKPTASFLSARAPYGELALRYMNLLLDGKRKEAGDLIVDTLDAPESAATVSDIYLHVFQPALYEIGRLWQINDISVAEEHLFTAATQLVMSRLYPRIFTTERKSYAMMAACVDDELHEVGIRMVSDFFEMNGWDTTYLGANMPQAAILDAVKKRCPNVLAISLTMSYRLHAVAEIITRVRRDESCRGVKILVGGYCFRAFPDLWEQVNADGYATDAAGAVETAERLVVSGDVVGA